SQLQSLHSRVLLHSSVVPPMKLHRPVARFARGVAFAFAFTAALAIANAGAQEIVLGQVGPFSGIPVPDAPEIRQGIEAYLQQADAAGGVRGHKLSTFDVDDKYTAEGFVAAFGTALQRKPLALLS